MNTIKLFSKRGTWIKFLLPVFAICFVMACSSDDDEPGGGGNNDVTASFQFEIDPDDFLTVSFSNFSQNATSYAWDFGDGMSSTEESPSHTYAAAGDYTVILTASDASGNSSERSESFTLTDPNSASKLLTGETSKTWKLYREGISMSLGPDAANPTQYWGGLANDGSRPCLYEHEFTFHADGTYEFDDKGMFWAEFGVFNNVADCEQNITAESCFEVNAANMMNACNEDVSAWGSGSHTFTYDPSIGELALNGMGAWIGIPKLTTTGESRVPVNGITTKISIEEMTGFDVMLVEFIYDGGYWPIRYANYSDSSLEPALETEAAVFGEDLPDVSPTEIVHSMMGGGFAIDSIASGSTIEFGVTDPADASALCGQFNRTDAQFQELQFQTTPDKNDINFENLTSVSIDVYIPSSNDYSGGLTTAVIIGLADRSATEQWWTDHQQYEVDGTALMMDAWNTVTFTLDTPSFVANPDNGSTPFDRNDFDMIFLNIGGSNHTNTGTFFVRNLSFQ